LTAEQRGDGRLDGSVNDRAVAPRVAYRVWQRYRYSYSAPVHDVRQCLVLIPPTRHLDQHLVMHSLDVTGSVGGVEVNWEVDRFGNRVCRVAVQSVSDRLEFVAEYEVERNGAGDTSAPSSSEPPWSEESYLELTALTAPNDRLRLTAKEIERQSELQSRQAELAAAWVSSAIRYRIGVTSWETAAATALQLGYGVCQDYAHLLLSLLRVLGIPARYVSGHLLGEGAPHAWVEALCTDPAESGGVQLVEYDPTHRRQTGPNYIRVAVGRDFGDISPTSGSFRGRATGRLSYAKRAEVVGAPPALNAVYGVHFRGEHDATSH